MGDVLSRIGVPLRLRPTFDEKPWGGRRLGAFGKCLPDGAIGESLESGPDSTIEGGPWDGTTLTELASRHSTALLGNRGVAAARHLGDFPLLVKLLDAHEDLSVQVHPNDMNAPPGKRGKTEAWLVLETAPGASLVMGVTGALDPSRIDSQIVREHVASGDVFLVPAGTVHAIGSGVLLYEIQQASDVTYRLYDWGRVREMHLEAGVAVADPGSRVTRITPLRLDASREMLVACRHFALERWILSDEIEVAGDGESCRVVTVIQGVIIVGSEQIECGASVLLPADVQPTTLTAAQGSVTLLIGYIPDLEADVIAPLRAAGHVHSAIQRLGIGAP